MQNSPFSKKPKNFKQKKKKKMPRKPTVTEVESDLATGETEVIEGKFGTFTGVFRPTILTILGVMMYLREGWVVGNAGLIGALVIILLCYTITGATALSLSSITSNIRIGSGGVFSIATQSLGIEIGGSIGLPFYLAQGLSVAMYIYGFMEGWLKIFPDHPAVLVISVVFCIVFAISYISASLAFRVQIIVMVGVIGALISIFGGLFTATSLVQPELWGTFQEAPFWVLFAVFFPASTGIMVGASMSGNLKDARHSIPLGTLSAWAISLLVYAGLAVWYSLVASPYLLRTNFTIAVDKSMYGPLVLLGILASCFTAALSSFVAAPRILQSLGEYGIVPFGSFIGKLKKGEPRNAMLVTAVLGALTLSLGDLNTIAKVLTIFFLMTYFIINFIVIIEKNLNLLSFRPSFSLPWYVPVIGSALSLASILVVSPMMGLICILASAAVYIFLSRRSLNNPHESLGSGMFESIAKWAANRFNAQESSTSLRSWKPDILVPVEKTVQFEALYPLLRALVYPQGSLHVVGIAKPGDKIALKDLESSVRDVRDEGIFSSWARVDSSQFAASLRTTVSVLQSSFFRPNIVLTPINERSQRDLDSLLSISAENKLGLVLVARHQELGLGRSQRVNVWIRDQSPNWHLGFNMANIDLLLLLCLKLILNTNIELNLISLTKNSKDISHAKKYLEDLLVIGRIPAANCKVIVEQASFVDFKANAPRADFNLFGLGKKLQKKKCLELVRATESTCLFIRDSGYESILI